MYEDIKTACLYVRFSSHNQTEQSIEGQTRVCRDFCKRHNIRIVEIYADRATSASKDIEKRVQFLKMIKDSEKGLFDAVIVYKLDRFARSRYDSATYKYRLKRNGVQLISATENISNDPEGIILESVLEGMAEFYSAELSQKINRGMRESAYKHNSIGGAVPLGYKIEDKKLVIDPKTAPIVKEAFEKYADGETVAEICRQFNARGYKTSKGTAFGKSSFTKIFRNERYIGVYTFHDYRAEDAIPAIIDKDLWDRVQLRVGKIKNAPARNKAKVVYLLSGKIFCGHCGSKMNGNCNAGNYCYYQCYGKKNGNVDCKKKNIRKEFIEKLVAQDALSLLTDEYIEQIATIACEKNQHEIELDSALPTIRDRIHQVDLSLNNLLKAIESGSAPDMLVKRMGELEKEKKDLQAQAKKESEDIVELDKAQVIYWLEQFRGGSIEDEEFCRMLIDLFVNSVTVWDEDDNTYKVTVAYNLTSLPTKTYRLNKGGTLSDFASNAPAMNIHRSAFGGRNFEYYSECGVLSGLTAAAEVSGATENGLICYVKHFAFNDQDNYRQNNICTWLNEQAAREIYLKAFEQSIKAGGMGVMTSMNAVGPVWAGGCKALLTNILRDEWGFHGAVITDAVVSTWYMDGNLAIRTGGTKMLAFNITNEFYRDLNSVGTVTAMRNAAHGTLYALANSFAVTRAVSVPKWVKTTYAVDAVVAIILVAWEICAIRKYRKAKKEDEDTEQ